MNNHNTLQGTTSIIPSNSTIIVGFSGGPDSIYLLLFLKQLQSSHNLTLIAAHLDHEWRSESAHEALWCNEFCKQHNIEFVTKKASSITLSNTYKGSKEQHARMLRRTFFEQITQQYDNAYIALAHHKDDQIETFFIRLARGTSLRGLTGMKQTDGLYVRPLLNLTKAAIVSYLDQHNIEYLQDPTNINQSFLRNRIRHVLIPTLPQIDTRLQSNIFTTMQHLEHTDNFLHQITLQTIENIKTSSNPLRLHIDQFLELHPILQQRILLLLLIQAQATFIPSQALFAEIIRFLQSNKHLEHNVHQTYNIVKQKNSFSIMQQ